MRVIGLIVWIAVAQIHLNSAWASSDEILFSRKFFTDIETNISVSGTLAGDGIAYKNNTYTIFCTKFTRECSVTSISQIGDNQVSKIDINDIFQILIWNATEIIATLENSDFLCWKSTIKINRENKTVLWIEEPVNRFRPNCENVDGNVRRYTIEDSIGWKKLNSQK